MADNEASTANDPSGVTPRKRAGRGNFFSIDRRTWAALCDLQDVKLATAYLVIAQGTLKGGQLSAWSSKSIEVHTGLHRSRAKDAITAMIDHGFLRLGTDGSRYKPRYEVVPFHEVAQAFRSKRESRLSEYHALELGFLRAAGSKRKTSKTNGLCDLVRLGVAVERDGWIFPNDETIDPAAELIWLPNAIVQGTDKGEPSPLRLLRGRNDIWALRLFVDLYDVHNLSADGGIARAVLWREYKRQELGRLGRHIIWGFTAEQQFLHWTGPFHSHKTRGKTSDGSLVWESVRALQDLGLLYSVAHLVENEDATSEIIHPFGTDGNAEPMELEIGNAAQAAGEHMLDQRFPTHGWDWASKYGKIVPVYDTYPNVSLVGVYRLRYRPHTSLTAEWQRRLVGMHKDWIPVYLKLAGREGEIIRANAEHTAA